jgi:peptidoglycan/LPS O-acetylase OafA/YrhL
MLPFCLNRMRIGLAIIPLVMFLLFAAVSTSWSPMPVAVADIDFAAGRFNIKSEVLRVGLLLPALAIFLSALGAASDRSLTRVRRVACLGLVTQLIVVTLLTVFEAEALELFSSLMSSSGEGVQNISRNSLIMAMAAPSLVLLTTVGRSRVVAVMLALLIIGIEASGLIVRGVHAGLLAMIGALLACAIVWWFPRIGLRVIATGLSGLVLTAPWMFGWLAKDADASLASSSMEWRLAIWRRVVELIHEAPLFGNGLGVLRTIDERIPSGAFAGELLIPNHSHNMLLQLWAETGAVGAGLLALSIVLAAWSAPQKVRAARGELAIASLIGGLTATACVSFDLWNAWWWSAAAIIGALAIAIQRGPAFKVDDQGDGSRTITFGSPVLPVSQALRVSPSSGRPSSASAAECDRVDSPVTANSSLLGETQNNFDLMRLIFASVVAIYHGVKLSGVAAWDAWIAPLSVAAELGVQGFFVLSGYLVMGSFERSPSILSYLEKRARRILPAYAVVIFMCAIAAVLVAPEARGDLLAVWRYIAWNLAFLNFMEPNLPGVFVMNPASEINGALWTLKIEVLFYLGLPLLAYCLRVAAGWRWLLMVLIYVGAEIWREYLGQMGASAAGEGAIWSELARQLPGQMSFFITGIALFLWRGVVTWKSLLPVLGLVLLGLSVMYPSAGFLRAVGIGVVAVWCSTAIPQVINLRRLGDLSYGVYIIHFPIIQTAIAVGAFECCSFFAAVACSAAIVVGAAGMWRLIERPALGVDSRYRGQV